MRTRLRPITRQLRQVVNDYKPTWRILFVLLLLVFFLALSGFFAWAIWGVPLVIIVTVLAIRADLHRSSTPADFSISRQHNQRLTLGQANPIQIGIENLTNTAAAIELWDAVSPTFTVARLPHGRNWPYAANLKGNGRIHLTYYVRPTKRGDHTFGQITLRWTSQWGLFMRQASYSVPTTVKVHPNLLQIRQYEQLARRGRQIQIGLRPAQQFGSGSEFEQLREYVPDDDYRRISWKATARHGKPITMDYSPDRSQNIVLLIDMSRQMKSRPLGMARVTRLDLIINAVLLFSYVALKRGDRVGMITFAERVHKYIPPRAGSGQLMHLVEGLYNVEPQNNDPAYALALHYLQTQRQRRSLIVMLTDPSREEAIKTLVPHLGAFYPHHLPLCVTLSDPNVLAAAQRPPYSMSAIQERALAEQILDERQLWRTLLEQRGVMTMDIPAYHLTAGLLNKYLELKGQTRI
ncbi:MAG: DUF58 domain-containing protein [Chloroflexi bacterium]|nr:DUF58 domain-containing protein [Chloroflexota bacterium]